MTSPCQPNPYQFYLKLSFSPTSILSSSILLFSDFLTYSGRRGGMITGRSVESFFCTASVTMAENDYCLEETGLSATDVMLAKLTLSPCHISTQLYISADRPIKHGTKAKGRTKKANTSFCIQQCKHKGRETDSMVQCYLCQPWVHWRTTRRHYWLVEQPYMPTIAGYCCAIGEHCIKIRGGIDAAKRHQC